MAYSISLINQAFYIAFDECLESDMEHLTSEQVFHRILAYCEAHAVDLLSDAACELWKLRQSANYDWRLE